MEHPLTVKWGSFSVPLLRRDWKSSPKQPYRKTYALSRGQKWHEAPISSSQFEAYAQDDERGPVPVGALIAKELLSEGASTAAFVEMWAGRVVFVGSDLVCMSSDGPVGEAFQRAVTANENKAAGFPDVIGIFPDGRTAFREAKSRQRRDRLSQAQHRMADSIRKCFAAGAELAIVEWDF